MSRGLEGRDGRDRQDSKAILPSGSGVVRRDRVDLEPRVTRQLRGLDRDTCGLGIREVRGVDVVHGREVIHVRQKDGRADDLRKVESRGLQQCPEVVHDPTRAGRGVAGDELARFWVDWNLPGQEKERSSTKGRRIRAPRRRRVRAGDLLLHAALVTLPDRRHRVQTLIRRVPPPMLARTF